MKTIKNLIMISVFWLVWCILPRDTEYPIMFMYYSAWYPATLIVVLLLLLLGIYTVEKRDKEIKEREDFISVHSESYARVNNVSSLYGSIPLSADLEDMIEIRCRALKKIVEKSFEFEDIHKTLMKLEIPEDEKKIITEELLKVINSIAKENIPEWLVDLEYIDIFGLEVKSTVINKKIELEIRE